MPGAEIQRGELSFPCFDKGALIHPCGCVRSPRALAEGIVCLATSNRGNDYSPTGVPPYPLVNFAYSYTPKCGA